MQTNTPVDGSVPRARASLEELSDDELLAGTRRLVGRSNQLLAELLVHLGEVGVRGIHRTRACSSLYAYCIYELRFSEDEAFRRVAAARLVRRFPALLDALASGELHLTGLLMLGPHLTEANLVEVLARAKYRTKRELGSLVRLLDPLPAVPARIEPLGPAPARLVPPEPSWQQFIESTCPVRELAPGDRPGEWMKSANDWSASSPGQRRRAMVAHESEGPPPARDARSRRGAQKEEVRHHRQLARASKTAEVLLQGASGTRRKRAESLQRDAKQPGTDALEPDAKQPRVDALDRKAKQPRADGLEQRAQPKHAVDRVAEQPHTRRRGRHIPASVRRTVFERDGNRCSYLDANGTRCSETHRLEFHHLKPFASSGDHSASNLTLRCAAHNALAAEEDFGRELIEDRKASRQHEALRLSGG